MQELCELIESFCEESEDLDFSRDYSGRFMFGSICIGIICDNPMDMMMNLTSYLAENGIENAQNRLGNICSDSMGLQTIVYFPELHYSE